MSGAGGKWMVSSIMEGHIKKLRKAGYLASDIAHRLPKRGSSSPLLGPMRGWYSSPISSADWASLCIHLSGGSCSTTAWISTI